MIAAGQKVRCRPAFSSEANNSAYKTGIDSAKLRTLTGTVIYVHPKGRFATVEFDFSTSGAMGERLSRKVRESFRLRGDRL